MTQVEMIRGETPVLNVTARWQSSDGADGGVIDLTGAALTFLAKRTTDDPDSDAIVRKTIGDGIYLVHAAQGTFQVQFDRNDWAAILRSADVVWGVWADLAAAPHAGEHWQIAEGTSLVKVGSRRAVR